MLRHLPNFICLVRIALVWPVVAALRDGRHDLALALFTVAAVSDGLDGFLAKRFNWTSELGKFLDPLADKLLMLAAIVTLSFTSWPQHFPLWFPVIVIFRDMASIGGAFLVDHFAGKCVVKPHWTGKVATFFQITAISWVLLDWRFVDRVWPTALATLFTVISGFIYLSDGVRQIKAAGHD